MPSDVMIMGDISGKDVELFMKLSQDLSRSEENHDKPKT
jgi:hypothetical protein